MPSGVYERTEWHREQKKGQIPWNKGKKTGHTPWNKGKKGTYHTGFAYWKGKTFTKEHAEKISRWHEENKMFWKGDFAGYAAMHKWVEKLKGKPNKCELCGKTGDRFQWANVDHQYKRKLEDYIRMCPKCHCKYDKENNLRDGAYERNRVRSAVKSSLVNATIESRNL